jgi:hypothetical protein
MVENAKRMAAMDSGIGDHDSVLANARVVSSIPLTLPLVSPQESDVAFAHRAFGLRRGVGDGSGAEPGLVGEHGSAETDDHDADEASGYTLRREGARPDGGEGGRQFGRVDGDDGKRRDHVQQRHTGDQPRGGARNGTDAADDYQPYRAGHDQAQ